MVIFVAILSGLGIVLASMCIMFSVRTWQVDQVTYKLIQKHKKNDYIIDRWSEYLWGKIDKRELHLRVTSHLNNKGN